MCLLKNVSFEYKMGDKATFKTLANSFPKLIGKYLLNVDVFSDFINAKKMLLSVVNTRSNCLADRTKIFHKHSTTLT